jgi:hypothetical protein|tara:strand:- start:407 stop:928 length:522 start_codon:yes stop_codon:yes gene_type:complete
MKKIFLSVILLVLTSCVTSKITSNKSPNFNEKIEKLFIMVKGSDSTKPFFQSFVVEFRKNLNEKNIESKSHYFSPLSLESENEIDEKISNYNPKLIMMINQTESRQTINNNGFGWGNTGLNTGGTFDVKIFQPDSKNPVWRANLKADGQFGLETSAKKAVEKLIEKLIEDKLL